MHNPPHVDGSLELLGLHREPLDVLRDDARVLVSGRDSDEVCGRNAWFGASLIHITKLLLIFIKIALEAFQTKNYPRSFLDPPEIEC